MTSAAQWMVLGGSIGVGLGLMFQSRKPVHGASSRHLQSPPLDRPDSEASLKVLKELPVTDWTALDPTANRATESAFRSFARRLSGD